MKKLLLTFLIATLCLSLLSCQLISEFSYGEKVYELTYSVGGQSKTLKSIVIVKGELEKRITYKEFESAETKLYFYSSGEYATISINNTVRSCFEQKEEWIELDEIKELEGETYCVSNYGGYAKYTFTSVSAEYVEVTIIDDNTLEISYYQYEAKARVTERIKPDSYQITYFND